MNNHFHFVATVNKASDDDDDGHDIHPQGAL